MAAKETKPACRVLGMDHIVLKVPNPTEAVEWYGKVLGLEAVRLGEWKEGKVPFPSVRLSPSFLIDFFPAKEVDTQGSTRNLDHLCMEVEGDLEAIIEDLKGKGVEVVTQQSGDIIVKRFGARGVADSLYFKDLNGNEVELRVYPTN